MTGTFFGDLADLGSFEMFVLSFPRSSRGKRKSLPKFNESVAVLKKKVKAKDGFILKTSAAQKICVQSESRQLAAIKKEKVKRLERNNPRGASLAIMGAAFLGSLSVAQALIRFDFSEEGLDVVLNITGALDDWDDADPVVVISNGEVWATGTLGLIYSFTSGPAEFFNGFSPSSIGGFDPDGHFANNLQFNDGIKSGVTFGVSWTDATLRVYAPIQYVDGQLVDSTITFAMLVTTVVAQKTRSPLVMLLSWFPIQTEMPLPELVADLWP